MTPPKSRLRSKTDWVNLITLALTGAEMQLGILQPFLAINVYALIAFLLPIVNIVLREVTDTPLLPWRPAYTRPFASLPPEADRLAGRHKPEDLDP